VAEEHLAPPAGCREPLASWDGREVAELEREWGVVRLLACASVGSTNDVAASLAQSGCPAATCVLADEQTAGRGRKARTWVSPPGLGIWLSLILRPRELPEPGALPLLVGLAVVRALDGFCEPGVPMVKWPNDVLVGGRKLGGILCESAWSRSGPSHVVVGIGLNVLHEEGDFPPELREAATSVRLVGDRAPRRSDVAAAVVRSVLGATSSPLLDDASLAELTARDALRGRFVVVEDAGRGSVTGVAEGIGPDGGLRLRTDGGVVAVRSGTVRIAGAVSGGGGAGAAASAGLRG
jgi:BirA family transcriptional regulator, biotin operon repressor / biotin---[acetyl-CoA-carboxylase] ligase